MDRLLSFIIRYPEIPTTILGRVDLLDAKWVFQRCKNNIINYKHGISYDEIETVCSKANDGYELLDMFDCCMVRGSLSFFRMKYKLEDVNKIWESYLCDAPECCSMQLVDMLATELCSYAYWLFEDSEMGSIRDANGPVDTYRYEQSRLHYQRITSVFFCINRDFLVHHIQLLSRCISYSGNSANVSPQMLRTCERATRMCSGMGRAVKGDAPQLGLSSSKHVAAATRFPEALAEHAPIRVGLSRYVYLYIYKL